MRQETRLIKDILQSAFPQKKVRFQYIQASSYYNSSDKLIVTIGDDMDINAVISVIKENVRGISVYRHGGLGVIHESYGKYNSPEIWISSLQQWHDADVLEFIEVRKSKERTQ